jgi:CHAD domain-containing protein
MDRDNPLARVLHRRVRALQRRLPGAAGGDPRGVHQTRVASRRLRETVPVVAAGLPGGKADKARRTVRRLTRALGGVRELDVALALLDEPRVAAAASREAVERVRAHLGRVRDARHERMLARLGRMDVDKLTRRLVALDEARAAGRDRRAWRAALAARLTGRAARLRDTVARAGAIYLPDRLHDVRIAAKKLRYALELAEETGVASARSDLRGLERVQDVLGRMHDLEVLGAHIQQAEADPDFARSADDDELERLASACEEECRRLHGRYLRLLPVLRETCDRAARDFATLILHAGADLPRRVPLRMTLRSRKTSTRAGR